MTTATDGNTVEPVNLSVNTLCQRLQNHGADTPEMFEISRLSSSSPPSNQQINRLFSFIPLFNLHYFAAKTKHIFAHKFHKFPSKNNTYFFLHFTDNLLILRAEVRTCVIIPKEVKYIFTKSSNKFPFEWSMFRNLYLYA